MKRASSVFPAAKCHEQVPRYERLAVVSEFLQARGGSKGKWYGGRVVVVVSSDNGGLRV